MSEEITEIYEESEIEDVYNDNSLLENDEISPSEYGFMIGYNEDRNEV